MAYLHQPRTSINLKTIPITIFICLILCKLTVSRSITFSRCNDGYNETNNQIEITYRNNLDNLLAEFPSKAASLSFYNSTAGQSPGKAYAHFLCRGDITTELCHSCVTNLTNWVSPNGCTMGWAFMETCMLRYANYSFFGDGDNAVLAADYSAFNATNVVEYDVAVRSLVGELISEAALESAGLFATREVGVGNGTVYGMAQCTPDIGSGNCSVCLNKAYSYLRRPRCCVGRTYAWAILSSCQLRYDNSTFYELDEVDHSNAQVVSPAFLQLATWTVLLCIVIRML